MSRPRLLIISYSPLYRDARVLRQIRLFVPDYEVTTVGYGEAPDGVARHVRIPDDIVYWHKDRRLLLTQRYQRAYDTAPVTRYLRGVLSPGDHDVILANDVDTVPLAITLRPRAGVHADLHEYASRQNEDSWRWRWFVAPYVRWLLRTWMTRVDSVTTVAAGLAAEYRREFGITASVVNNAGPFVEASPTPTPRPIRLVHSGIAVAARLQAMLAAMDLTSSDATLDLFLVDVGDGLPATLRSRHAGNPKIRVLDPVGSDELVTALHRYDVGLSVLPPATWSVEHSLPNKFFDFVQARLAIVVGPNPEMAALVREHDLGVVANDYEPATLARIIDALTPEQVDKAKRASDAAADILCAENQVAGWTEPIARLAART